MSIAAAIRKMVEEDGLTYEQALRAAERVEEALSGGKSGGSPVDAVAAKRRAYDRERKASVRAEQKRADQGDAPLSTGLPPEVPNGAYIEPTLSFSTDKKKEELGGVGAREKSKRGTRMTSDWCLQKPEYDFAVAEGMSHDAVGREAAKFRDHFLARAGPQGVKLDWPATWRNWIRNNRNTRRDIRNGKPSGLTAAFDRLEARISRRTDPDAFEDDGLHGFDPGDGMPGFAGRLL